MKVLSAIALIVTKRRLMLHIIQIVLTRAGREKVHIDVHEVPIAPVVNRQAAKIGTHAQRPRGILVRRRPRLGPLVPAEQRGRAEPAAVCAKVAEGEDLEARKSVGAKGPVHDLLQVVGDRGRGEGEAGVEDAHDDVGLGAVVVDATEPGGVGGPVEDGARVPCVRGVFGDDAGPT